MEPLSNIDTAWLRMEGASHPMIVTMVMTLGAPLDLERLESMLEQRLLQFRRFRQRVIQPVQPHARPHWQDDPGFDPDYHLQPVSLQSPGDEAALRDLISKRRYLQSCGERVDGLRIRTGLSVNLRSPEEDIGLGNHAGAFLISLPIGVDHPLERFSEVKRTMDALKSSHQGTMIYGLLNALGMAPAEIQDELVASYCTRETAMTANVPGPTERLNLAGAPLEMLLLWVPAFGSVGLNLNVASYAGQIRLGVASDKGLVPHPERIVEEFMVEFDVLRSLADAPETRSVDGAASDDSFEALSAMLDDAVRTLDDMLGRT